MKNVNICCPLREISREEENKENPGWRFELASHGEKSNFFKKRKISPENSQMFFSVPLSFKRNS